MKRKIVHKLFFQVLMYFVAIVLVFTALISVIFTKAYESDSTSSYKTFLEEQVKIIAERMQQYVISNDLDSYLAYMEMLEDSLNADVWVFSNKSSKSPMNSDLENINITDSEMSKETKQVLNQAYLGNSIITSGFNSIRDESVITIGAPIYEEEQSEEVVGAVLLLAPIQEIQDTNYNIKMMFVVSVIIAMLIAFVFAAIFARKLSLPITRIKKTTKELADGTYDISTNIIEKNEIGELAASVDKLADRLKENEVQRNYMEQMRKDFFSNISHELRTPITVMRAYLESLLDGVVSEEKVIPYYNRMLAECTGMQRLVQDLLLLSKMENPDFTIELEPVNIVQVFDDIVRSYRVICSKKNITIELDTDTDCCFINGDYDRIRQVFLAILDNAIKFSNSNSTIYIKVRTLDNIIISIRDEGVGISEENITHIFDKFYTKKQPNNQNGSGLGLVIAKEIVKKHHGSIEVSSEVGKGTTFVLRFTKILLDESYL
ncbi:MAG: ATP-binding protein [bacterium]|nr:ATP-binding protein [bacterium]